MDIFCILLLKCPSENWARNRFNDCPVQKLTIHYDSILLQLLVHVWAGQTQLCSCLCILLCSIKSRIGSENTRICSGNILMYLASHMHCFQEQCHTNIVFFISKFFHESIFHKVFLQLKALSPMNGAHAKCDFYMFQYYSEHFSACLHFCSLLRQLLRRLVDFALYSQHSTFLIQSFNILAMAFR